MNEHLASEQREYRAAQYQREQDRKVNLHNSLDELCAEWIAATACFPSKNTVLDLMTWSAERIKE